MTKTVLTEEEATKRAEVGADDDAFDAGEDPADDISDPSAIVLPTMPATGGVKFTKGERMARLSADRNKIRKALADIGGVSGKHYDMTCTLFHTAARANVKTSDGILLGTQLMQTCFCHVVFIFARALNHAGVLPLCNPLQHFPHCKLHHDLVVDLFTLGQVSLDQSCHTCNAEK